MRLGRNGTSSANRTGGNVCRPDARTQRLLTAIGSRTLITTTMPN